MAVSEVANATPAARTCGAASWKRKPDNATAVMFVELPSGMVRLVWSCAVKRAVPAAGRMTWNVAVPPISTDGAGSTAVPAVEVRRMTSEAAPTVYHAASQARTTTSNGTPVTWASGVPVLPDTVPGAATSPGSNT